MTAILIIINFFQISLNSCCEHFLILI